MTEGDDDADEAQAVIQQASLLGQAAIGERAGKRARRMRLAGERPSWSDLLERVFRVDGFACPGCGGAHLRSAAWW